MTGRPPILIPHGRGLFGGRELMFCIAEGEWKAGGLGRSAPVLPLGTRLPIWPRPYFGLRRRRHSYGSASIPASLAFARPEEACASAFASDVRWRPALFLVLIHPDTDEKLTFIATTSRQTECVATLFRRDWLPGERPTVELAHEQRLLRDEMVLAPEDRDTDLPIFYPRLLYRADGAEVLPGAADSDSSDTQH
jgi:hypothetical protein